jgi:hypothetical protein
MTRKEEIIIMQDMVKRAEWELQSIFHISICGREKKGEKGE